MTGEAVQPEQAKAAAQLLLMLAQENGYLTQTQCAILKGMTGDHLDVDGVLSLVTLCKEYCVFTAEMNELAQQIKQMSGEQIESRIGELQAAPRRVIEECPLELQWFCFIAVRGRLLTEEQCLELDMEMGQERDFLKFAQALVMMLPDSQFAQIQQWVEKAMEYASMGRPPPTQILAPVVTV